MHRDRISATRETIAERRVDIIVSTILGSIGVLAFTLAVLSKIGAI